MGAHELSILLLMLSQLVTSNSFFFFFFSIHPQISPIASPIPSVNYSSDGVNTANNSSGIDREKKDGLNKEENVGSKSYFTQTVPENCQQLSNICRDDGHIVACVQSLERESRVLVILIQNEGESSVKVHLRFPTQSLENSMVVEVQRHHVQQVNVSGGWERVVVKAGEWECLLEAVENLSVTTAARASMGGPRGLLAWVAFAVMMVVTVFGGVGLMCSRMKARADGGTRYQEIEMGVPLTTEGWDRGWDDDWDEAGSVVSPGRALSANISSKGLITRMPKSSAEDG